MSEHVAAQASALQRTPFADTLRWRCGQRVASLLIFATLAFAGCVRFDPKPLSPTETATNFSARTLSESALQQFMEESLNVRFESWPVQSWDFQQLKLAAWYFHPKLDQAVAQLRVADAAILTAGGRPKYTTPGAHNIRANPFLTIKPEYVSNAERGTSPWAPEIGLDIPLETSGKRAQRIAKAEHLAESARLNVASVAWQVRTNLRAQLVNYITARDRRVLLQNIESIQLELIRRGEQRLDAGEISAVEVSVLRVQVARTKLELVKAFQQAIDSHARVADAIGIPASALLRVEVTYPFSSEVSTNLLSAEARRLALQSRSDLLGALADYAASEAALRFELARQYPNVHLAPGYQWDQAENKWSLGLKFELPAVNRNQGPIAEAEARRKLAEAQFFRLQASVLAEIDRVTIGYRAARERLEDLDALLRMQREQRDAIEIRSKAGAVSQVELLDAQLQVATAELLRFEAAVKFQQALGVLEDAMQQPAELLTAVAALNGKRR